ncbi:hypothetical protein GCM10010238_17990 [Streptomyces griseoviridis]|uniref:Uncharacterized protein n=2 Tax=Streptomyces griseoviridis TaxID=45398 RepID=A0A918GDF6_STRGD|nr:hypothetical protein GCM10010238_17990 [Streptomyces niveoruber]
MHMRFVFVHGTGVRRKQHDRLFGLVKERLAARFPESEITSYYWGDDHGATLAFSGASVPGLRSGRASRADSLATAPPLDLEVSEWQLLLTDPLCELRLLAEIAADDGGLGMPGVRASGLEVADRMAALPRRPAADDELAELLKSTSLNDAYEPALDAVSHSEEFEEACAAASDQATAREVAAATGRAVVAQLLADSTESALCTGGERDRLVDIVTSRLGGTGRGRVGRVGSVLLRLAMRLTTQPALDHWRGPITTGSVPALGDILRYQARGGPLRDSLTQHVTALEAPTVVLGHSLGGIALFDVLALASIRQEPLHNVRLLVTVGSQAPFLHELGALTGLPPGASLPPSFPRWLNIYDRKDLLAYQAKPVFAQGAQVTDHEVASRQPFPVCHSAYWKLDDVYDRIAKEIEALG